MKAVLLLLTLLLLGPELRLSSAAVEFALVLRTQLLFMHAATFKCATFFLVLTLFYGPAVFAHHLISPHHWIATHLVFSHALLILHTPVIVFHLHAMMVMPVLLLLLSGESLLFAHYVLAAHRALV